MKLKNRKKTVFIFALFAIFCFGVVFFLLETKNANSKELKVFFATDFESGEVARIGNVLCGQSQEVLGEVVKNNKKNFRPDVSIGGGDLIKAANVDEETAKKQLKKMKKLFWRVSGEKYLITGDHDVKKIEEKDVNSILQKKGEEVAVIDKKGFRMVMLNSGLFFKEAKFEENKERLRLMIDQEKPVLVFSHHNLIDIPKKDRWVKEVQHAKEVREVLESSSRVVAVFMGESSRDHIEKEGGIVFFAIPGIVNDGYLGSFAQIKMTKKDELNIELEVRRSSSEERNWVRYLVTKDIQDFYSARIRAKEEDPEREKQEVWEELGESSSEELGTENNLEISQRGEIFSSFQAGRGVNRAKVRSINYFKKGDQWKNSISDGFVSKEKGGDPFAKTFGDELYLSFMDFDNGARARIKKADFENDQWKDLADEKHPLGIISKTKGHEPVISFDKDGKHLFAAFSEGVDLEKECGEELCYVNVKRWDGEKWEDLGIDPGESSLVNKKAGTETALAASKKDNSIFLTFEETESQNKIKTMKWNGEDWKVLSGQEDGLSSDVAGFSPSIAVDQEDNIFLAFIGEGYRDVHIRKWDGKRWEYLDDGFISTGPCAEVDLALNEKGELFAAFSEKKVDAVCEIKKKGISILAKNSPWRVRVKKWNGKRWMNMGDETRPSGFISRGNAKGDPSMIFHKETLFVAFTDREIDFKVKVLKLKKD